ncbi:iron chelate uptake ABC transporter family permease subunit [Cellulomonas marina]|uniref:Iron complex transport system permease protein n=1 Tax=Cellulomonas marina TaxID=988821 RepID=A0A1I0XAE8_9CELL|nr:iron chelate uptake ABC transporter family permease subunit [Cellulomonas marina]GIG29512.1 enterochelin ABC transporter permease [Cellulomonas marina]SFA97310.1 iron complex transport system permease protein [Cellulomonas marina]
MAEALRPARPPVGVSGADERRSGALPTTRDRRRYVVLVGALAVAAVLVAAAMVGWDNPMPVGSEGFWRIAELRVTSLVVVVVVAFCQALGTVAFQTVTANRILTPSIMGFEALYRLVQTAAVSVLGVAGLALVQGVGQYVLQVVLMVAFAGLLYGWLFTGRLANLHVMLLVGIVLGGGMGALASYLQRLLSPTEFDLLTARLIGSVANADATYLGVAVPLAAAAGGVLWWRARDLDVLALGRDVAVGLGVDHRRRSLVVLLLVSVLMAVSTSLVGPMTFFGFLTAMIAYQVTGTYGHRQVLPVAWLVGVVVLGGAYVVLKHVFYAAGSVGVLVEVVGGTFFLVHLLRKGRL